MNDALRRDDDLLDGFRVLVDRHRRLVHRARTAIDRVQLLNEVAELEWMLDELTWRCGRIPRIELEAMIDDYVRRLHPTAERRPSALTVA